MPPERPSVATSPYPGTVTTLSTKSLAKWNPWARGSKPVLGTGPPWFSAPDECRDPHPRPPVKAIARRHFLIPYWPTSLGGPCRRRPRRPGPRGSRSARGWRRPGVAGRRGEGRVDQLPVDLQPPAGALVGDHPAADRVGAAVQVAPAPGRRRAVPGAGDAGAGRASPGSPGRTRPGTPPRTAGAAGCRR